MRRPRDEEREKGEREEAMQISEMQTKSKDSNETCARQIEREAKGEEEGGRSGDVVIVSRSQHKQQQLVTPDSAKSGAGDEEGAGRWTERMESWQTNIDLRNINSI